MAAEKGPAAMFVANEGDAAIGGQNGGAFVRPLASPKAATALTTDGWADVRPLSEQLSSYPATCFLAALFVTVRREERNTSMLFFACLCAEVGSTLSRSSPPAVEKPARCSP